MFYVLYRDIYGLNIDTGLRCSTTIDKDSLSVLKMKLKAAGAPLSDEAELDMILPDSVAVFLVRSSYLVYICIN